MGTKTAHAHCDIRSKIIELLNRQSAVLIFDTVLQHGRYIRINRVDDANEHKGAWILGTIPLKCPQPAALVDLRCLRKQIPALVRTAELVPDCMTTVNPRSVVTLRRRKACDSCRVSRQDLWV
jgi:hypothetical protein